MGATQLRECRLALLGSALAVRGGLGPVLRRPRSIPRSLLPQLGGVGDRRSQGEATGRHLPLDLGRVAISSLGSAVTGLRGHVTLPCGRVPLRRKPGELFGGLRPSLAHLLPLLCANRSIGLVRLVRRLRLRPGMLEQLLVGCELVGVGSRLVLVRSVLIRSSERLIHRDLRKTRQIRILPPTVPLAGPFFPGSLSWQSAPIPRLPSDVARRQNA